ncbi:hypothetical protein ABIB29_003403 [Arthrobacter sp. UYEF36]
MQQGLASVNITAARPPRRAGPAQTVSYRRGCPASLSRDIHADGGRQDSRKSSPMSSARTSPRACPYCFTAARTAGSTSVASIAMDSRVFDGDKPARPTWARKRVWPRISCSQRILSTISAGLPAKSAPHGAAQASKPCAIEPPGARHVLLDVRGIVQEERVLRSPARSPPRKNARSRRSAPASGLPVPPSVDIVRPGVRTPRAPEDRQVHRQPKPSGTHRRGRRAADRSPDRQVGLGRARPDSRIHQRGAGSSVPGDGVSSRLRSSSSSRSSKYSSYRSSGWPKSGNDSR